jgi:hypothetical protein
MLAYFVESLSTHHLPLCVYPFAPLYGLRYSPALANFRHRHSGQPQHRPRRTLRSTDRNTPYGFTDYLRHLSFCGGSAQTGMSWATVTSMRLSHDHPLCVVRGTSAPLSWRLSHSRSPQTGLESTTPQSAPGRFPTGWLIRDIWGLWPPM